MTMREGMLCAQEEITINMFLVPSWSQSEEDIRFSLPFVRSDLRQGVFHSWQRLGPIRRMGLLETQTGDSLAFPPIGLPTRTPVRHPIFPATTEWFPAWPRLYPRNEFQKNILGRLTDSRPAKSSC